ncbi:hypothetical protein JZU51_00090 [bacterium]|nr:hypothetical protein [bacterium]
MRYIKKRMDRKEPDAPWTKVVFTGRFVEVTFVQHIKLGWTNFTSITLPLALSKYLCGRLILSGDELTALLTDIDTTITI